MTTLIHIEQFPQTSQLVAELRSEFAKGADTLVIVDNDQILGTFLSREATQKALRARSQSSGSGAQTCLGTWPTAWKNSQRNGIDERFSGFSSNFLTVTEFGGGRYHADVT